VFVSARFGKGFHLDGAVFHDSPSEPAMNVSDRLTLQLALPGLLELEPLVRDFASHSLRAAGFSGDRQAALLEAFVSAIVLVEDALRRQGDPVIDLKLQAEIDADGLEFRITEQGMPLGGTDATETPPVVADVASRVRPARVFDRLWWAQKGTAGSELHLRVHRPHPTIDLLESARHRLTAEQEAEHTDIEPSEQTGEYRIRGYRSADGLAIARQIYEAYGRSYVNPDLYVPERIELLNSDGRLHSIVCESPAGDVVGHYALERPDLGPTGEAGQAVIDHRHRGHGLMRPMREAVEQAGRALGLLGVWSQPTAMHPLSQRMNLDFGSIPSAIHLGLLPEGTTLRGGVAGEATDHRQGGRRSTFLYWHPLCEEPPLAAHAPREFIDLLAALYEARRRPVSFNVGGQPQQLAVGDPIHSRYSAALGAAWIIADRIEPGAAIAIEAAAEALETGAGAGAVFVDLPLDDPGTPGVAEALLTHGFTLAGIAPRVIPRRDSRRAEDALRLAHHPVPPDLPGLVAEGELGRRLAAVASRSV
jgi:hypothetical protein